MTHINKDVLRRELSATVPRPTRTTPAYIRRLAQQIGSLARDVMDTRLSSVALALDRFASQESVPTLLHQMPLEIILDMCFSVDPTVENYNEYCRTWRP